MKFYLFLLTILTPGVGFIPNYGQEWDASKIPDTLKENAYAIVRKNSTECEVMPGNILMKKEHFVITILSKSGDFLTRFYEYYDNYKKIKDVKVNYYNSEGKKVNSFGRKAFNDFSAINDYSLYEETRVLTYQPNINNYPYTVEYISTTQEKDFISFPSWNPLVDEHVSCENSEYKLILPENYKIRYKFFNLEKDFTMHLEKDKIIYQFSLLNHPAIEKEPYSPPFWRRFPHARIVPETFNRENYQGSYKNWENYGSWAWSLKEDREDLQEEAVQKIKELAALAQCDKEKVLVVYKYLQNTTRYVNIAYGIGGYQPHPAMSVYSNGYGDCKALSNYMQSMLKVLGINSIYTLVYAGSGMPDIIRDFPSQQFNHAILCVPLKTDTLWLECTSQTSLPGFLGYSLDDRTVLLVDKIGGRLARTKKFEPDENIQWRKAVIEIDEQCSGAKAKVHTEYKGQQYSYVESIIHQSKDDQKEFLIKNIDIPQFTISDFSVINHCYSSEPTGFIDLELDIYNYVTGSDENKILPLNLMNRYHSAPKPDKDRINDIFISASYYDIDSIDYRLPANMSIEFVPEDISLKESFGEYSLRCEKKDNSLLVIREIKIKKGTYPKVIYPTFVAFYKEILKADRCKALFKVHDQNQNIVSK